MPKESGWVTINGVHVFIDNSGKISKGPAKFIGSSLSDLPSSGKQSQSDLKARLQAKQAAKEPQYDLEKEKKRIEARKNPGTTKGSVNTGSTAESAPEKPKRTPEKREATATDVLGVNGSDPTGVAILKDMRSELMIKAINNDGKLSKADQKKLDLIEQELNDSPWNKPRSSTRTRGSSSSSSSLTPSEKLAMESGIGFDTDFSKMTKKEIEAGMAKLEKAMQMTDDMYTVDAYDAALFEAQNAIDSGNYKKSVSTTKAATGNSAFDGATKSNKKTTTGKGTRGKATQSKPVDLEVAHYDGWGFGGSRNVYTAVYPDGTRKNISATQAKEFFPDSPATQHIRPRGKKRDVIKVKK